MTGPEVGESSVTGEPAERYPTLLILSSADAELRMRNKLAVAAKNSRRFIRRDAILKHLQDTKAFYSTHLPEISFMTFRIFEIVRSTGEQREQRGIEGYTFEDIKIAMKDVYRKTVFS